jgi:alanine racemase
MDQLMVDCGDDDVATGDDVVIVGSQSDGTAGAVEERIGAEEVAARLGTIGYEITCAVSARVPRVVVG